MSFGFKKKKGNKKDKNNIKEHIRKDSKLDVLSRIDDIKIIQKNHYLMGNYHLSIKLAKDIIELAQQADITTLVKEQESFIEDTVKRAEKKYRLKKIKRNCAGLLRLFDKLVSENQVETAHGLVENFVKKFEEFPEFNTLFEVQQLTMKDAKVWINFLTEKRVKKANEENRVKTKRTGRNLKAEMKENCNIVNLFFDKLIVEGNIEKAHRLVEDFVKKYDAFPIFNSLSEVRELIEKDAKEWINYITEKQLKRVLS